jgi:cysteine-rich repeat protein
MIRLAALALGVSAVALAACSFDWEPYDPRLSSSSTSQGPGGAGGQGGVGGVGGVGGDGGDGGDAGGEPSCGDGVIDTGEQCDDGANESLDGCDASCEVECEHLLDPTSFHCYAFLETPLLEWSGARDACAQVGPGFDHAGVSSQAEHDWLSTEPSIATYLVDEVNGAAIWLGGSDADIEGDWQWVNGEPFFEVWAEGEPSNDGTNGEDCVIYLRRLGAVSYDDRPCDRAYAVLCERAPAGSTP